MILTLDLDADKLVSRTDGRTDNANPRVASRLKIIQTLSKASSGSHPVKRFLNINEIFFSLGNNGSVCIRTWCQHLSRHCFAIMVGSALRIGDILDLPWRDSALYREMDLTWPRLKSEVDKKI